MLEELQEHRYAVPEGHHLVRADRLDQERHQVESVAQLLVVCHHRITCQAVRVRSHDGDELLFQRHELHEQPHEEQHHADSDPDDGPVEQPVELEHVAADVSRLNRIAEPEYLSTEEPGEVCAEPEVGEDREPMPPHLRLQRPCDHGVRKRADPVRHHRHLDEGKEADLSAIHGVLHRERFGRRGQPTAVADALEVLVDLLGGLPGRDPVLVLAGLAVRRPALCDERVGRRVRRRHARNTSRVVDRLSRPAAAVVRAADEVAVRAPQLLGALAVDGL
mmetsp:Transcript_69463/g.180962  ORF Transcript_69463/g.180962 Transcript_69463/m.180962 type:complete len:277 (+) Transcript_69463:1289-2119(+)